MKGVTESMAGRAAVFQLLPFSLRESAKVSISRGGFPEVLARPSTANVWFRSYIQTYLERDVRAVELHTKSRHVQAVPVAPGEQVRPDPEQNGSGCAARHFGSSHYGMAQHPRDHRPDPSGASLLRELREEARQGAQNLFRRFGARVPSARAGAPRALRESPFSDPYSRDSSPQKSRRIKSIAGRERALYYFRRPARRSRWTSSCRSAGGRSPCSKQRPHEHLCPIWQSLSRDSHRTSNATKQPLSSCAASPRGGPFATLRPGSRRRFPSRSSTTSLGEFAGTLRLAGFAASVTAR